MQQHNTGAERNIFFYHANIGYGDDKLPLPFDPTPALEAVRMLISNADWYEEEADGSALCLFPSTDTHQFPVARFGRVRRIGLPQVEQAGAISDLDIAIDQGLLECIHVVFFPNNVVGAEYNHYGPRVSRLGHHLHEKSGKTTPRASMNPILRSDAARQLDNLEDLHVLDLSILPSGVETVAQAHQPIGAALRGIAALPEESSSLQLVIRPAKSARPSFLQSMINPLKELLGDDTFRASANRLRVEGHRQGGSKLEAFDLLRDDIATKKAIIRLTPRGRALDPDAAFEAIIEAYRDYRDEIDQSPTLATALSDDG